MNLGKKIRLNRIFGHPSGHLCSVAVDHFVGYGHGMPDGLRDLRGTLKALAAGLPDAVTMQKGVATGLWAPYAGKIPLIIQSSAIRPDDVARETIANVDDAIRLGADALAIAAFVRGSTEAAYLRVVADAVRDAARYDLPIICHIYPRVAPDYTTISFTPEDIAWAVRCAVEVGVDVVKTPYCGDVKSYAQIVADCPLPLVAAGGPKTATLKESLASMLEVIESGALGATIGRNIWGSDRITESLLAYKAVIHDGKCPDEALRAAGL